MAWQKASSAARPKPDNSVNLFRNEEKKSDQHADYKGNGKINGREYWASAWINTSKTGQKYMSIKFKPKEEQTYKRQSYEEAVSSIEIDPSDEIPF